ncbi:HAMP domain-containing histidine kinase [Vagococcus silagei]|uniref:histidine kinase n=2 Tax=Vagococcus silagei TaxID=2508885 RepID=A0A4S3B6D4_9ENTE|nr:HAMP domain-containing histidine kinase [Vagococcus silagei]
MIYIMVVFIVLLLIYLIRMQFLIRKIIKQLVYINSIQTNTVIEIPTRNREFKKLSLEINRLLQMNKENYQKVIESNEQFDMAINNISHDIRTPLTVANGYVQLLNRSTELEKKELVEKIRHNLDNVEEKLEDLLTYNRLIEQRVEVDLSVIKLSSLLEKSCLSFYNAFTEKNINVSLNIEQNILLTSDETILTRIIENAIGNILNHGVIQTEIILEENDDKITMLFSNKTTVLIENYDKLFERFYTEDFARVNKNSGLGLFIIQELTNLLGGSVSAYGGDNKFNLEIQIPKLNV